MLVWNMNYNILSFTLEQILRGKKKMWIDLINWPSDNPFPNVNFFVCHSTSMSCYDRICDSFQTLSYFMSIFDNFYKKVWVFFLLKKFGYSQHHLDFPMWTWAHLRILDLELSSFQWGLHLYFLWLYPNHWCHHVHEHCGKVILSHQYQNRYPIFYQSSCKIHASTPRSTSSNN